KYIAREIRRDIAENLVHLSRFRENFSGHLEFADSEPFHITVKASESGYDGAELAELLRKNGVECEYADSELIVLLSSPFFRPEDYAKLSEALEKSLASAGRCEKNIRSFSMKLPEKAMRIREAVFSTTEDIDVENSEGRICGAVRVPCPPAVPIAASGEIIDRNCINIFKSYGISTVNVVK
ncbi:MAG: amino acid decarboxylase, partial [Ruminococcus sp.]|nr:amino acid decarboxylase [Ruminococcus sp.]